MSDSPSLQDKINRAAQDAGEYFRTMAHFVGFDAQQTEAIYESRYIIEKHIPEIVSEFYIHLLRYPPTRQFFLSPDGSLNTEYVQMRMQHLANFWRRTAYGPYDDQYARYIDYVGRAHTQRGADPNIDIAERYVIGQIGFMQHSISEALSRELHPIDPAWEIRALKAWNLLMMVLLEMLARVYHEDELLEAPAALSPVNVDEVKELAINSYEMSVGLHKLLETSQVFYVADQAEIPTGQRKIVKIMGLSVGIFHHNSGWYAVRNQCLHAGGPVAEGPLRGETLVCPWHGYQYDLSSGQLLSDPSARLEMYPVELQDNKVFINLPITTYTPPQIPPEAPTPAAAALAKNEFRLSEIGVGQAGKVEVAGEPVAVFNVAGSYFAVQGRCSHAGGPLSEGRLEGTLVTCPWHGACFDLRDGSVQRGPARQALRVYPVTVDKEIGRVEP